MNIVAQINAIVSLRLLDAVHVSYDVADQRDQKIFLSKILNQFWSLSLVAIVVVDWVVDFTFGFVVSFFACVGWFGLDFGAVLDISLGWLGTIVGCFGLDFGAVFDISLGWIGTIKRRG